MSSTHDVTKKASRKVTAPAHCRDRDWFIMAVTQVLCAESRDTGSDVVRTAGVGVTVFTRKHCGHKSKSQTHKSTTGAVSASLLRPRSAPLSYTFNPFSHTYTYALFPAPSARLSYTHTHTRTHARTHARTHILSLSLSHTHTHTHTPSLSLLHPQHFLSSAHTLSPTS